MLQLFQPPDGPLLHSYPPHAFGGGGGGWLLGTALRTQPFSWSLKVAVSYCILYVLAVYPASKESLVGGEGAEESVQSSCDCHAHAPGSAS